MSRKVTIILLLVNILIVFPAFSQPKRKIYVTLDTSGSMYGDKYMISNYTAQLISILGRNDDVYMICNGLPKKISGDANSYKQIQFNYSLIRAKWGVSPLGSQIGDIATFNNLYGISPYSEQWLFIIGDGNWESYKFPQITERFASILKGGNLRVFFIPYGNITDGQSDFIDYLRTLKTPKILNGSRDLQSVISNCVIIFSYLTGNSGKNIELSLVNSRTVRVTSPLQVKKYTLFYQDETDENSIIKPISAVQDTVNTELNLLGIPTTTSLRYKDNQTLLSATLWDITSKKSLEADVPLIITFNGPVNLKKLKFIPTYNLEINSGINYLKVNNLKIENVEIMPVSLNLKDSLLKKTLADSTKIVTKNKKIEKPIKNENIVTLSENSSTTIHLKKLKNNDSVNIYTASVKLKEKIDTSKYSVEISHSEPLLFKTIATKVDSNQITFTLESRGKWSENFTPDTISLKAKLLPKKSAILTEANLLPKTYDIKADTTENGTHTERTKNLMFLIIFSLILLLYFFALTRKVRFKKGALLDYYSKEKIEKTMLRKSGFSAWFNRWFNPFGAEKIELSFFGVQKSLTFVANRTKYSIRIPQNLFDNDTMTYKEYSPNKNNFIEFIENRELTIKNAENKFIAIKYDSVPAVKDDRTYYRMTLWGISFMIIFILILL